jgi:O-antigen/teichoic acid export membrane protein
MRKKLIEKIVGRNSKSVMRGIATLLKGGVLSKIIGLISVPLLTRLYSPEDFGAFAIFTAYIAVLAPLATFRYTLAIPLPRHDGAAMNLAFLSLILLILLSALSSIALFHMAEYSNLFPSFIGLSMLWWLVPVGMLSSSIYESLSMWATRRRDYDTIARTTVVQSASGALIKILMGTAEIRPLGLIVGQIVAGAGGTGIYFSKFMSDIKNNFRYVTLRRILKLALIFKQFPTTRVPSQFLLMYSIQAPIFYFASSYGADNAGQLSLAVSTLAMPLSILGQTTGRALYAESARVYKNDKLLVINMANEVQSRLFLIGLIPALLLYFFGESLFSMVFGQSWSSAGNFASILSISLLFQFTSSPLAQLMNLVSKQMMYLGINCARALGITLVFVFSSRFKLDPESALLGYSIFMSIFYVLISYLIIALISREKSR